MIYDQIPATLKACPRWINWNYGPLQTNGKRKKIPMRSGRKFDYTQKENCTTFQHAVALASFYNGIGFVFFKSDGFCGIDIDTPQNAEQTNRARAMCEDFDTYIELSPSGTGWHIICYGALCGRGTNNTDYHIEMYDDRHYFTFTGNVHKNNPISNQQSRIDYLYQMLGGTPLDYESTGVYMDDVYHSVSNVQSTSSDDAVIALCKTVKNSAAIFQRLMDGITSDFAHGDLSRIDFIFCNYVSAHTKDVEQIERIFRCAGIGKRDITEGSKYYNQSRNYANYIERTIRNSLRFNDVSPFAKKGV